MIEQEYTEDDLEQEPTVPIDASEELYCITYAYDSTTMSSFVPKERFLDGVVEAFRAQWPTQYQDSIIQIDGEQERADGRIEIWANIPGMGLQVMMAMPKDDTQGQS